MEQRKSSKGRNLSEKVRNIFVPMVIAAAFGGIARVTETPELIATPFVMDIFFGGVPIGVARQPGDLRRWLYGYAIYAVGVSLPYADKIYTAAQNLIEKR